MIAKTFFAALLGLAVLAAPLAAAADPYQINLGLQQTGTAQWEITAMQDLGIDKKHNIQVNIRPLATDQAGQVALQTGTVDIILTDFIWVSLQRHQGNMVTIVPHSLAVGGLMTDPDGPVKSVADLKGKTIAASGTPVDKSWVILQAYYGKQTGGNLADDATVKFGAPPLIAQLLNSGQAAAALNFWSWNAKAQAAGKVQLASIPEMLKGLGVETTPPLLGWAFMDSTAASKPDAIKAFLDASFETKQALLTNDDIWNQLRDVMGVKDDDTLFKDLRDGYREGIVRSYGQADIDAAAQTFGLLAKYGGTDVVGDETELSPGTFYAGYSK